MENGVDVLSNVLSITRLGNSVLNQSELLPPWGLEVDQYSIAAVHVVQRGRCWLRVAGGEARRLEPGDLVLVARGVRHTLAHTARSPVKPYEKMLADMRKRLAAGETDPDAALILCVAFEFPLEGPHPLLSVLPPLIHLKQADVAADARLRLLLELLLLEATAPKMGAQMLVPRLVDGLLVFIVRTWLERQPRGEGGWMGALRDPLVGRALELMHSRPAHPWSVEGLAAEVATSRPTLVRRFTETVGTSPAAYLARWRMTIAAQLLRETDASLDQVALKAGYDGAASLSKAFKRQFGQAPGAYRKTVRDTAPEVFPAP
jgi:AraC-like DNA-binding protein